MTMTAFRPSLMTLALLVALAGCRTTAGEADRPALIVDPDAASRAALQDTLSNRFGGLTILLANDALTRSSLLTLEVGQSSGRVNQVQGARVVSEPYRFQLVGDQTDCYLIDLRDDSRHALADTRCRPE